MIINEEIAEQLRMHLRIAYERIRSGEIDAKEFGLDEKYIQLIKRMDEATFEKLIEERIFATLSELGITQAGPRPQANPQLDGARLFLDRGMKAYKSERYEEARKYLKRAVEIHPQYKAAWLALSGVYEALGDTVRANRARLEAAALTE